MYDVLGTDGKWNSQALTIQVEGKPVYQQLSVDEYNEMATAYNAKLAEARSGSSLTEALKAGLTNEMVLIDPDTLCTEGDPWSYKVLGSGNEGTTYGNTTALGYAGGTKSSSYEVSSSHSETREHGNGWTLDLTIIAGAQASAGIELGAMGGIETSIEEMRGHGTTTESGQGYSVSGNVTDLSLGAFEAAGYEAEDGKNGIIENYKFKWRLAARPSEIPLKVYDENGTALTGKYVPIIGYAIGGLEASSVSGGRVFYKVGYLNANTVIRLPVYCGDTFVSSVSIRIK